MNKFGKKLEKRILKLVDSSRKPVSTREISLKLNVSWHSVNTACLKLQLAGKLKGFAVGNINLWEKSGGKYLE